MYKTIKTGHLQININKYNIKHSHQWLKSEQVSRYCVFWFVVIIEF